MQTFPDPDQRSEVRGLDLDLQTRCRHYHSALDIVAIKMKCCGVYYACKNCHIELAGHAIELWPRTTWIEKAILCGDCGTQMTINDYLQSENHCPACHALFNPACRSHYHFYFGDQ